MLKIENLFRFRRNIPITRSKTKGLTEVREGERESKVDKNVHSVVGVDQMKSNSVNQSAECRVVAEELPVEEGTAVIVVSSPAELKDEGGGERRQGRHTYDKL